MYLTHHTLTGVCSEIPLWQHVNRRMGTHPGLAGSLIWIHSKWALTGTTGLASHWSAILLPSLFDWVCLITEYFSGHLPLFYEWRKNDGPDSKWLVLIPTQYREKDVNTRNTKSNRFSATNRLSLSRHSQLCVQLERKLNQSEGMCWKCSQWLCLKDDALTEI